MQHPAPDWWRLLPFVLSAGGQAPRLSITRIIEALIIAGICSGVTIYATQQVLGVRIQNIERSMDRMEHRIEQIQRDLYVPRGSK